MRRHTGSSFGPKPCPLFHTEAVLLIYDGEAEVLNITVSSIKACVPITIPTEPSARPSRIGLRAAFPVDPINSSQRTPVGAKYLEILA